MSDFGKRLKELRIENNLLGRDLAAGLNIDPSTLTNWEKGNRFPREDMIIKICDYFDCSIDYLFGRTDNKKIDQLDDYPYRLTGKEVKRILEKLNWIGFRTEKLIYNLRKYNLNGSDNHPPENEKSKYKK